MSAIKWKPPANGNVIQTLDVHAAGEPLRIITSGLGKISGKSMLAKRRFAQKHLDQLRRGLMWEPRGHADMYGAILTEPASADGDLGVLFLHNKGFSTMCGHGVIALVTAVLETGLVKKKEKNPVLRLDTPAGRVTATAWRKQGRVERVSFLNVPSFVYARDKWIDVEGIGRVSCDVAFGGAFYAFCRAEDLGVELEPLHFRKLIELGMRVKRKVMQVLPIRHPFEKDLGFLYGTIIVGPAGDRRHHSRNVCIFAEGEVDRSPTGTGISARAALHFARGELVLGQPFTVESLVGTCFTGKAVARTRFGPYDAVVPEVSGSAHIIGLSQWLFDPKDPLGKGFFLR